MKFNLEVQLRIEGAGHSQKGIFTAKKADNIAEVAYKFIKQIKRDTGYRETVIEHVYVDNHDITDLILELKTEQYLRWMMCFGEIKNSPLIGMGCLFHYSKLKIVVKSPKIIQNKT